MVAEGGDDEKRYSGGKQAEEEEEEYADAVTRHAKYLGIDPEKDAAYMWIAEEALNADVPEGWITGEGEGEYEGLIYYYNEQSGESTWDHPLDEFYRDKFKRKRARDKERRSSRRSHHSKTSRSLPSSKSKLHHHERDVPKSDRRKRDARDNDDGGKKLDSGGAKSTRTRHRHRDSQEDDDISSSGHGQKAKDSSNLKSRRSRHDIDITSEDEKSQNCGNPSKSRYSKKSRREETSRSRSRDDRGSTRNGRGRGREKRRQPSSQRSYSPSSSPSSNVFMEDTKSSETRSTSSRGSRPSSATRSRRTEKNSRRETRSKSIDTANRRKSQRSLDDDRTTDRTRGRQEKGRRMSSALEGQTDKEGLGTVKLDDSSREHRRIRRGESSIVGREEDRRSSSKHKSRKKRVSSNEDQASSRERSRSVSTTDADKSRRQDQAKKNSTGARATIESRDRGENASSAGARSPSERLDPRYGKRYGSGLQGTNAGNSNEPHHAPGDPKRNPDKTIQRRTASEESGKGVKSGAHDDVDVKSVDIHSEPTVNFGSGGVGEGRDRRSGTLTESKGSANVADALKGSSNPCGVDEPSSRSEWNDELQEVDIDEEMFEIQSNGTDEGQTQSVEEPAASHVHVVSTVATRTRSTEDEAVPEGSKPTKEAAKIAAASAAASVHHVGRRALLGDEDERAFHDNDVYDSKDNHPVGGYGPETKPLDTDALSRPRSGANARTVSRQGVSHTTQKEQAVSVSKDWRRRELNVSPMAKGGSEPNSGESSVDGGIIATSTPANLASWNEPTPRRNAKHTSEKIGVGRARGLEDGTDEHTDPGPDRPADRSAHGTTNHAVGHSADGSAKTLEKIPGKGSYNGNQRSSKERSAGRSEDRSQARRGDDKDRGPYGITSTSAIDGNVVGTGHPAGQREQGRNRHNHEGTDAHETTNVRGIPEGGEEAHDFNGSRAQHSREMTGSHYCSGRAEYDGSFGRQINGVEDLGWSRGRNHHNKSNVFGYGSGFDTEERLHESGDDARQWQRLEYDRFVGGYDGYGRRGFHEERGGYRGDPAVPSREWDRHTFGIRRSVGDVHLREETETVLGESMILRTKVERLERALSEAKWSEDRLRDELAAVSNRESDLCNQNATAFEEESKRASELRRKLSAALLHASQEDVRVAEAEAKAASAAKLSADLEWTTKVKDVQTAAHNRETNLRSELETLKEELENITDETLARKEADKEATVGADADVPSLRARVKCLEAELESQGSCLSNVQRQHVEASTKLGSTIRELHKNVELAERNRSDAAENRSRASTAEAALAQATREMSTLNDALARLRGEATAKEHEAGKTSAEIHRLRSQLAIAQDKSSALEERFARGKMSSDSLMESFRGRATELEAANACMAHQMHTAAEDSLTRLREVERERDAALYESKRSADRASDAEAWRQKEAARADTAEGAASDTRKKNADLQRQVARIKPDAEETIAVHVKKNAELKTQLDTACRQADEQKVGEKHRHKAHVAEISSLKEEISKKLPEIAEDAAKSAGRHWRKRAESEIHTVKAEGDRRLSEAQAAISESEAKRHAEIANMRVDAERFRMVAEKLAAENRSLREGFQRVATENTAPCEGDGDAGRRVCVHNGAVACTARSDGDHSDLHAQMLSKVEAHINSLRAQLQGAGGRGAFCSDRIVVGVFDSSDDMDDSASRRLHALREGRPNHSLDFDVNTEGSCRENPGGARFTGDIRDRSYGRRPRSRGGRNSAEGRDEALEGLTEEQEMHLCRLLRSVIATSNVGSASLHASGLSTSTSPSVLGKTRVDKGHVPQRTRPELENSRDEKGIIHIGVNASVRTADMTDQFSSPHQHEVDLGVERSADIMIAGRGQTHDADSSRTHGDSSLPARGDRNGLDVQNTTTRTVNNSREIARELFPWTEPVDDMRDSKESTSSSGAGHARNGHGSVPGSSGPSAGNDCYPRRYGFADSIEAGGNSFSRLRGDAMVGLVGRKQHGKEADDLEDISDGGFHSGCWRRKYASGEMR